MKLWTKAGKLLTRMGVPLKGDNPCVGACCLPNGDCVELCQEDCESSENNGSFQGRCSNCTDEDIACTEPATYDCVDGNCVEANGSAGTYSSLDDCNLFCDQGKQTKCEETTDSSTGVSTRECVNTPDNDGSFDSIGECESAGCDFPSFTCVQTVRQTEPGFRECVEGRSQNDANTNPDCTFTGNSHSECCCCRGYELARDLSAPGQNGPDSGTIPLRNPNANFQEEGGVLVYSLSDTSECRGHGSTITLNVDVIPAEGYVGTGGFSVITYIVMDKNFQRTARGQDGSTTNSITLDFNARCRSGDDTEGNFSISFSGGARNNATNRAASAGATLRWTVACCRCESGRFGEQVVASSTGPGTSFENMMGDMMGGGGSVV